MSLIFWLSVGMVIEAWWCDSLVLFGNITFSVRQKERHSVRESFCIHLGVTDYTFLPIWFQRFVLYIFIWKSYVYAYVYYVYLFIYMFINKSE